ncbi:transcription antitermination factor NusB, partial [Gottfriedia acidiceleris]|uniref:transcription antitermination factor NusB n=2 Tax=Gottfriedia acidiceleris TaxID=371036 RepID=UPI002FFDA8B3
LELIKKNGKITCYYTKLEFVITYATNDEFSLKEFIILMKRRKARELALQTLFQMDLSEANASDALEHVLEEAEEKQDAFLDAIVTNFVSHKEVIDEQLASNIESWTIDRLGNVDRNILRIALVEISYLEDVPKSVAINEAIEIAKVYGDDDSSKFINAVLSKF